MNQALASYRTGGQSGAPDLMACVGEAHSKGGRPEVGVALIINGLATAERTERRFSDADEFSSRKARGFSRSCAFGPRLRNQARTKSLQYYQAIGVELFEVSLRKLFKDFWPLHQVANRQGITGRYREPLSQKSPSGSSSVPRVLSRYLQPFLWYANPPD